MAIAEFAVHFAKPSDGGATGDQSKRRARMRFLSDLLGHPPTIAPTHAALVDKLGGTMKVMPRLPYEDWRRTIRAAWEALCDDLPLPPAAADYVEQLALYVEDTGADFIRTSQEGASFGKPTDADARLVHRLSKVAARVRPIFTLPPSMSAHRFDAHDRILDEHALSAYDRSVGRATPHTKNDAIDANMLQHLAEGLTLVTRDYRLVERVDGSGSPQAPWVCTVGELLAGRAPPPPNFLAGRLLSPSRPPRTSEGLRILEAQGEALAKTEWVAVPSRR